MTTADIRRRVHANVAEHLDVEPFHVTDESLLIETLGADSLDMVELCIAFEDAFQIEINDDETFYTPGAVVALVARKMGVGE